MLRLTWRNLLARKVRLLMSTLAIVLGIGFLAGVMTFSTGLNATFDNIVQGSTSDGLVRPAGDVQGANAGVGTTQVITPADVETLAALPEVEDAVGSVDGIGSFLLGKDGKLVGGQGAPTLAFNYAPTENMARRADPRAHRRRVAREARRGHPRHVVGRARVVRRRRHGHDDRADPRGDPADLHPGRHRRLQRRRHRRRHAGAARHGGGAGDLPRRPGRLHQRRAHRRRRRLAGRARRRPPTRSHPTASPPSPATRWSRRPRTRSASSSTSSRSSSPPSRSSRSWSAPSSSSTPSRSSSRSGCASRRSCARSAPASGRSPGRCSSRRS